MNDMLYIALTYLALCHKCLKARESAVIAVEVERDEAHFLKRVLVLLGVYDCRVEKTMAIVRCASWSLESTSVHYVPACRLRYQMYIFRFALFFCSCSCYRSCTFFRLSHCLLG